MTSLAPTLSVKHRGICVLAQVDLSEITVTVGENGMVKVRAPKMDDGDDEETGDDTDAMDGEDDEDDGVDGLDDLSGMGDDEEELDTYDENGEANLDFEDDADDEDEGYPDWKGTPVVEWSGPQTAGWLLGIEELSDEENEALEDLLAE